MMIIGIAAELAALAVIIALIDIAVEARKKNAENVGDPADGLEVENDNSIYNEEAIDDPFANEFEDQGDQVMFV